VHEAERAVAHIESIRGAGRKRELRGSSRVAVPRQPPGQGVRAGAAQGRHSLQGLGRQSFFDRAEIRDLCAWLRLIVNSDDDPAFLRARRRPKRGIGHQTLAGLGAFAGRWKASLFEALFASTLDSALPKRSIETLHEFGRAVNALERAARETTARRRRAPSCSAG
jgi:ATP-dependent DNA helicase Rep